MKLAKILPIRAFKLGPTQFQAEVERLKKEGRFPNLETLLAAIAETRTEFVPKILAARRVKRRGALVRLPSASSTASA
jgi:hypothetical protein